jgi:hypothetical protein
MKVICTNPWCCSRRKHHENDEPRGAAVTFEVPDDHVGAHYCSIECACYDGAYNVSKGWVIDPSKPRYER